MQGGTTDKASGCRIFRLITKSGMFKNLKKKFGGPGRSRNRSSWNEFTKRSEPWINRGKKEETCMRGRNLSQIGLYRLNIPGRMIMLSLCEF